VRIAAALVACAAALAGCREPGFGDSPAASQSAPVHAALRALPASYLGVYEPASPLSFTGVSQFAHVVRATPNLDLYFSGWGEKFRAPFARAAYQHGAAPMIDIDPAKNAVPSIAEGVEDNYLRSFAAQVRQYRHPMVISFGHEMNGSWFSWGYHHVAPATFVAAWRHIVTVFRQAGADNVTWLWIVNRVTSAEGPIRDYWPGSSYVTWVGIDGYYNIAADTFSEIFDPTIKAVRRLTAKPILISETAVGPRSGKAAKIPELFAGVRSRHLLGLVWFDKTQHDGLHHQDWRIEGDQAAIAAFRRADRPYR
jgi:hypothetical protein